MVVGIVTIRTVGLRSISFGLDDKVGVGVIPLFCLCSTLQKKTSTFLKKCGRFFQKCTCFLKPFRSPVFKGKNKFLIIYKKQRAPPFVRPARCFRV